MDIKEMRRIESAPLKTPVAYLPENRSRIAGRITGIARFLIPQAFH